MTLNDLIIKAYNTGMKLSSGDVPILLNGDYLADIDFSIDYDEDGNLRVLITPIKQ